MRLAFGLVAILVCGCTPEASKVDGFFSCEGGGGCPEGATCRQDGRCHVGTAVTGDPCDEETEGGFCLVGLSCLDGTGGLAALEGNPICGLTCSTSDDCPMNTECVGDECLPTCEEDSECRGEGDCRLPLFNPMLGVDIDDPVCVNLDERNLEGRVACANPTSGECMPPGFCLSDGDQGICSLRCERNDNCGMGGRCLLVDPALEWSQCFLPCTTDDQCGTSGLVCRDSGITGPEGGMFCMPSAWAGSLRAVNFDLMPMGPGS